VMSIDEAAGMEKERYEQARKLEEEDRERNRQTELANEPETLNLTKEERAARREQKKKEYAAKVKEEQKEMGMQAWQELDVERQKVFYARHRLKTLARLSEVGTLVVEGNVGMDVDVAHLGWFGLLSPRSTMIKAYAPNTGVRVTCHPSLALPKEWGGYEKPKDTSVKGKSGKEKEKKQRAVANKDYSFEAGSDDEEDDLSAADDFDDDFDNEFDEDFDFGEDGEEDGEDDDWGAGDMYDSPYDDDLDIDGERKSSFRYVRGSKNPFETFDVEEGADGKPKDPWAKYAGANVGWVFDEDTRFSKNPNIVDGWNPIPKTEEEKEAERKSGYKNKKRYG
jgi:hypothetical protein